MAVTKGEMTSLPTSQTIFLQTVEEPEDNRINFRDSLKFFQEQLVINGANFPSPSTGFRSGNNTLRKNGHRPYKEQNSDSNAKITKDSNTFENDLQSIKNCKIAIPTVDTILESVRVLRAIQKSQEERGSSWNLDVTPKSDIDFNCNDDWVQVTDVKQSEFSDKECKAIRNDNASPNSSNEESIADINENGYSDKGSNNKENNAAPSTNTVDKQPVTDAHQNGGYSDKDSKDENIEKLTVKTVDKQTTVNINQNGYSEKETKNENHETYSVPCGDKQTNTDTNQNVYPSKELNNNIYSEILPTSSEEKHTIVSENLNGNINKELNNEKIDETSSITTVKKQTITDTNQNEYFDSESSNKSNNETSECAEKQVTDAIGETHVTDTEINLTQSSNDSNSNMLISSPVNEICSFWPVNTLQKVNHWNEENNDSGSTAGGESNIVVSEVLDELKFKIHVDKTNLFPLNENGFDVKSSDKEDFTEKQIEQIDAYNNNILINTLEHSNLFQNLHEGITKSDQINDTPDSLRAVCTNFLNNLNEKTPNSTEISKEMLLKVTETTTKILKIETYEDIIAQKPDHFLLNESLWKETCSPSDSPSAKLEHNDSDSGIGTQRSASSLSPNNPNQMQKDSWSDTCSSHYASAECSPYHSLNNVFESSLGLNSTPGEAREIEHSDILTQLKENEWEDAVEKPQENVKESPEKDPTLVPQENIGKSHDDDTSVPQESVIESPQDNNSSVPQVTDCVKEKEHISDRYETDSHIQSSEFESLPENAELDTEISYCNFITNYTIEKPCERIEENFEEVQPASESCDNGVTEPKIVNGQGISAKEQITESVEAIREKTFDVERAESLISLESLKENSTDDDSCELPRIEKFSAASCDLISIVETLYVIKENPAYQILPTGDDPEEKFEETLFVLSKGAFCEYPEDNYLVTIEDSVLHIAKDSQILLSLNMKYGEVTTDTNILRIDNRMGRCVYVRCEFADVLSLQARIKLHCLKHWQTDCLQLVHYPLKCHQNVVIIDIGSCSTRAGILMDQPTLPSLFFPTICATDKRTGTCVYGMEALQPEVRQHSNLSFPVRPTIKITKHTIDIDLMEGLFKKIFHDLNVDPTQYTVQVCLPRNLSINAQTALVKLLLEVLKAKAVSLTNQALLTLYAHDVSTAVVVDIGDRTDVLPVVDGFIVENGVTKLPHGGQRLIHHMKHGLAEKRISLSNDIDSFIVQYIIENLAYVAVDYEKEIQVSSQYPDVVTKSVMLQPASSKSVHCKSITLEEARFQIPEGLFNPEMWGLDSPGIHHLVQKAIQATSVDARKRIAENIYVSGGVTMLPGFVERLHKEVTKLSKAKIVPKVYASNYRYHCTYIGACKFAKMEVFPQVCITLQEYTQNSVSALKKCSLYF